MGQALALGKRPLCLFPSKTPYDPQLLILIALVLRDRPRMGCASLCLLYRVVFGSLLPFHHNQKLGEKLHALFVEDSSLEEGSRTNVTDDRSHGGRRTLVARCYLRRSKSYQAGKRPP